MIDFDPWPTNSNQFVLSSQMDICGKRNEIPFINTLSYIYYSPVPLPDSHYTMSITEPLIHWPSGRLSDVGHMITHSFHWQNTNAELLKGRGDGCLIDELYTNVRYKLWALSTPSSYNHDTLLQSKSSVPYTHQSYIYIYIRHIVDWTEVLLPWQQLSAVVSHLLSDLLICLC